MAQINAVKKLIETNEQTTMGLHFDEFIADPATENFQSPIVQRMDASAVNTNTSSDVHSITAGSPITYTSTTLDDPDALVARNPDTNPTAINNRGEIVGYYTDATDHWEDFLYSNRSYSTLPLNYNPNVAANSYVYGINDSDQIIGQFDDLNGLPTAFIYSNGVETEINEPDSLSRLYGVAYPAQYATFLAGINDQGEIVGSYLNDSGYHGFVHSGSDYNAGYLTLDDRNATNGTFATAINNAGEVVGYYNDAIGTHGFIYENGTFTTIDYGQDTTLLGINDKGEIIGHSVAGNFLVLNGVVSQLNGLPGIPSGINDNGVVVGTDTSGHGFLGTPPGLPTNLEYWYAANAVWNDNNEGNGRDGAPDAVTTGLALIQDSNEINVGWLSDGFFAQAFLDKSGNVIVAFEASNPLELTPYGRGSLLADSEILSGETPDAFYHALTFMAYVNSWLVQNHDAAAPIYLTGHSLGGAEAEYVASATGESGVTFGAPSIPSAYSSSTPGQVFLNYVDAGDPIGNFGTSHFEYVDEIGPSVDASEEALYGFFYGVSVYHPLDHYAYDLGLDVTSNWAPAVIMHDPGPIDLLGDNPTKPELQTIADYFSTRSLHGHRNN